MFEIQKRINQDLLNITDIKVKQEKTKEFILAVMAETNEILEQINWAPWKKDFEVIRSNILEEVADDWKFLENILLIWGFTAEDFFKEYERKSAVVEQRFKQREVLKNIKSENKKVCAIDLDGVMVQYPEYFIDFINKEMKTKHVNLFDVRKSISNDDYMRMKDEYRQSGVKQTIPLREGAKEFIDFLRSEGYSIVIITKRPYKKYFRIFADTKTNLDNNGIHYDGIIFDTDKHKTIVKEFPQLEFIVEDDKNISNEIGEWGYKCFLIDNMYNKGKLNKNVTRVLTFKEIMENICETAKR